VTVAAPAGATLGRAALLLFLRHAPKGAATYSLPVAPIDTAWPQTVSEHEAAPDPKPVRVEVKGPAKFGQAPHVLDSWLAVVKHGPYVTQLHLDPTTRALLGGDGVVPPGVRLLPKGKAAPATPVAADQPAATWRAAFWKFGHGYHMAIEKMIVDSIHWATMYDHEVQSGGWPKERDVGAFRKAYVDEFLARSKHRPRAEADTLLQFTLATGSEKTLPDGTVVLTTHPEYGGNVYHFRAVGGTWYLVRIDQ
jgi:hypothetical protein